MTEVLPLAITVMAGPQILSVIILVIHRVGAGVGDVPATGADHSSAGACMPRDRSR